MGLFQDDGISLKRERTEYIVEEESVLRDCCFREKNIKKPWNEKETCNRLLKRYTGF